MDDYSQISQWDKERQIIAAGNSLQHLTNLLARFGIILCSMFVGGWFMGTIGIIIGMVVAPIIFCPFLVYQIRRYNVWLPQLDPTGFAVSALTIGLGIWIK